MLNPTNVERFKFSSFELCPATGELLKGGTKLKLQPQPFRLLLLLVSRSGELVTREEIRETLWDDGTTVEFDQSLNYGIRQIRAVLGEGAQEPKFIETLPKRGYRFIATVTPVMREESPPQAPRRSGLWWIATAAAALTLVLIFLAGGTRETAAAPRAILVRPFVSLGLPEDDAWFGDALTQQLIGTLAETKTVHVVPWSSSLALKGQSANVHELGKRFQVDAILEGSVVRSGERLRVFTQLVDVSTERILWSQQDEREARDLARMQDDVMNAIAGTLKLRLSEAAMPAARRRPQDLETYNLYLKAVALGDQFSRNGGAESVKDFEEVIQKAPGFAPAYAGLANELAILPFLQPVPVKETLARAKDAAQHAIALDPSLASAHTALAHCLYSNWDWKASEKEFQISLSLDPDSATAHQLYGLLLGSQGRAAEAIREGRRAADLGPTSGLIAFSLATILFHAGNFDEAIAQNRRALDLDPGFLEAYNVLARAYTLKGRTAEAVQTLHDWERYQAEPAQPLWRAYQLASLGRRGEAVNMINAWLGSNPRASRPPLALAAALLAAGEKDRALQAVRQSVDQHVPSMVWLRSAPELAALRSDPRFKTAVSMMNAE